MGKICKITNRLHGKSCALPTSKKICQVKKRVHLQQSGIISLAKSRSNLHQESWEKQVDFPNYWSCSLPAPVGLFFKLCKWVGKSYKKLYCIETITKACLLRCKITHTHTHRLQSSLIHQNKVTIRPYLQTRYAKSHTRRLQSSLIHQNKVTMRPYLHDEICKITHTSILLAGRRSCYTWSSNKLHFCWWLRELIPGLRWDHKAS
jgi:hypothetical protein